MKTETERGRDIESEREREREREVDGCPPTHAGGALNGPNLSGVMGRTAAQNQRTGQSGTLPLQFKHPERASLRPDRHKAPVLDLLPRALHYTICACRALIHWEIKGRFRKRVVLANVPSFRFAFRGNIRRNHPFGNHPFVNTKKGHWEIKGRFPKGWFWRTYPHSGFRSGGTSAKTTLLETTLL